LKQNHLSVLMDSSQKYLSPTQNIFNSVMKIDFQKAVELRLTVKEMSEIFVILSLYFKFMNKWQEQQAVLNEGVREMLLTYKKMYESLYGKGQSQKKRLTLEQIVTREGLIRTATTHKLAKLKKGILKLIDKKREDVQMDNWYNFDLKLDIPKGIELKLVDNVGTKEWDLITIQLKNFRQTMFN